MKIKFLFLFLLVMTQLSFAQNIMTPELLLSLKRVSAIGMSPDGKTIYYSVNKPNLEENKGENTIFSLTTSTDKTNILSQPTDKFTIYQIMNNGNLLMKKGKQLVIADAQGNVTSVLKEDIDDGDNFRISNDNSKIIFSKEVKMELILGSDKYNDAKKSNVYIYDDLDYRHWDTWNEGKHNHVFWAPIVEGKVGEAKDILNADEPYDCPQKPFGGAEDFIFDPESENIIYVCKKKYGVNYATSTNTNLYKYNISSGATTTLTADNNGYDTDPAFSKKGTKLAWLSMSNDGYESDKNDIIMQDLISDTKINLTKNWDGTVSSFKWSNDENYIYFTAPTKGTIQIFRINIFGNGKVEQISTGTHDITGIVGISENHIIVSKQDMNQATEIYDFNAISKEFKNLTYENVETFSKLKLSKIESRTISTVDGENMLVWVIYPPDYDANKKYPTLLYCQGGPQSQVSQYYSYRWNFQLMAAQGYIVLAPNRRGLPGFGTKWNEAISKDWGGMAMKDYLQTVDVLSTDISSIDKSRIGAVGASYGGYSVYMLAGIHQNRFKTFIAHDGLYDLKSWYGTTEELFFANWDIGGPYWISPEPESYKKFNPSNFVQNWTAPIMIVQGGIDFRVPTEQGLEAFQAAKLRGLKSRLLYFPEENHWVLKYQNSIVWQREFFKWLKETL